LAHPGIQVLRMRLSNNTPLQAEFLSFVNSND
jgi:hypothetical protein